MLAMQSTKAIVAADPTIPYTPNWSLQDVQCPATPGPGEVLVEIVASGLCHTDVFVSGVPDGTFGIHYPKILGHEGVYLFLPDESSHCRYTIHDIHLFC